MPFSDAITRLTNPSCIKWLLLGLTVCLALLNSTRSLANSDIVNFSTEYFEDVGSRYDFERVIKFSGDSLFKTPGENGLSFGWVDNPYWYKVTISAQSNSHDIIMLDISWPLLDTLDVYITNPQNELITTYQLGDHLPFSKRPVFDSDYIIPLNIKNEPTQTIYIKVSTTSSMQLPITFYSQEDYRKNQAIYYSVQGIFYGLLFVMVFYNLFVYLSTRRVAYLHYVGFVVSFGILQSGLKGSGFQFVWPNIISLNDYAIATGGAFSLLFLTLFARSFLQLDEVKALKKMNNTMLAIAGVFVFLSFTTSYRVLITPLAVVVIIFSITVIIVAVIRYRQGFTEARYYLLAWVALVIGCVIYLCKQLGFLPINFVTENSLQIGSAAEILLLSFALADRLNSLGRSLEKANQKLEKEVEERTSELRLALDDLSKANNKLSLMSITDSLTGLRNRYHFDLALEKEIGRVKRKQETVCLLLIDIDHFKHINDTWGHLTGDKTLQFVSRLLEKSCKRPTDIVCRYGGEEFAIVLPSTSLKGASLLARRICQLVEKSEYAEGGDVIPLTISIGVSSSTDISAIHSEHLVKAADIALYNAKDDGRNCVHIFDQIFDENIDLSSIKTSRL